MTTQISKKRKFVADGVFYAELNELLTRELAEDGYAGVDVRVTPLRTEIIIKATRTQQVRSASKEKKKPRKTSPPSSLLFSSLLLFFFFFFFRLTLEIHLLFLVFFFFSLLFFVLGFG